MWASSLSPSTVFLLLLSGLLIGISVQFISLFFIIISLSLVVALIPLFINIRRRSVDLFEPIIFKSVFMCMILIALVERVYFSEPFYRHSNLIKQSFDDAFLLLSILYLALFLSIMFGYYRKFSYSNRLKSILPTSKEMLTSTIKKISICYMVIGFGAYLLLLGNAMNWDLFYLFTTTEPRSEIFADTGSSILRLFMRGTYLGFLLFISTLIADGESPKIRHFVLFGLIVIMFALLGGRSFTLQIILMFIVILYYIWVLELIDINRNYFFIRDPTSQNLVKISLLPVIAIPIAVLTLMTRYLRRSYGFMESLTQIDFFRVITFGINNDRFDYFLILYNTDEIGTSFGSRYFRVLLNYIPRSIWENKPPLHLGSEIREFALPDGTGGRPPGEIGYYFVEFGYPGIIFLGILYGILLRLMYEFLSGNSKSPLALVIYAVVMIPLVVNGLTTGGLWTVINNLIWIAPVLIIQYRSEIHK